MWSGLLTTSKTVSGDASTKISRSIVPNSMTSSCNLWLRTNVPIRAPMRNHQLRATG
jgi:hypothetical protein